MNASAGRRGEEENGQFRLTWRSCLWVLLIGICLGYLILRYAGAYLVTGDTLERGDAIVVLGGGHEDRVEEAARLMKDGYGIWLIVTEPGEMEDGSGPGSQVFREVAILQGISPDVILITEKTAQSTYEEAEAVLHTMQKHQMKSMIVVTDPFHTQRTRLIYRRVFSGSGIRVLIRPVSDHWYRSTTWFLSRDGWENTLREYVKLVGFWAEIGY